jgi:putative molybdopterin biosynthesis protein
VGSLEGLIALERGEAHVAGAHLLDEESGEYNTPYIRRLLPGQDVVLVTMVERLQGLMVAKGNPRGIVGLEDVRRGLRFVNRQRGSGTRVLLDHKLRQLGISPTEIAGYNREETTHLAVAAAVADGSADVGLGIYAAARSLDLGFLPLVKERYDLVMLRDFYEGDLVRPLLSTLRGDEFRRVVAAMGGYDVSQSGLEVAVTKSS